MHRFKVTNLKESKPKMIHPYVCVCVGVYVCIYMYIYIYIHTHIHMMYIMCINVYLLTCIHIRGKIEPGSLVIDGGNLR